MQVVIFGLQGFVFCFGRFRWFILDVVVIVCGFGPAYNMAFYSLTCYRFFRVFVMILLVLLCHSFVALFHRSMSWWFWSCFGFGFLVVQMSAFVMSFANALVLYFLCA